LANGSVLNLKSNSLAIGAAGNINAGGETGSISINDGDITLSLSSTGSSHVYFDASSHTVKRLDIDKPGEIFIHSALNITEALKIKQGALHSDGNITLVSTSSATAKIEEIESDGEIFGDVHIQQNITETGGTLRFLTAPVEGVLISDWQNYFPITGNFSGASSGPGTDASVFIFSDLVWKDYPSATNPAPYNSASAPVELAKGYSAKIHNAVPVVMQSTGNPWQGTLTFPLIAPLAGDLNSGWNFVGNPFASPVQWNASAWNASNVNSVVAMFTPGAPGIKYEYYDAHTMTGTASTGDFANGVLQAGQAFFTSTTGPSPSLEITEKAKNIEVGKVASYIRMILTNGSNKDALVIAITPDASDAFDAAFDGLKRKNEQPFNFSSLTSDNVSLAINNAGDEFCAKEVRLSIDDVAIGTYTISVESLTTLDGIGSVKLVDHFLNFTADLNLDSDYTFEVTSNPLSYGDRFELVLSRSEIDLSFIPGVKSVCGEPVEVTLSNTQPGASYGVYNSAGEELAVYPNGTGEDIVMQLDAEDVEDGQNKVTVKASLPGCSSAELPQNIEFEYYHAPLVTGSNISVCPGKEATLEVSSTSSVASFEWFLNGVKIDDISGSILTTAAVNEELYYSVRAVQPNSCPGPETFIVVSPVNLIDPVISQDGDLIVVNVPDAQYEWFRNGISVATTTGPTFEFPGSGAYTVTVTLDQCSKTSAEFIITGVTDEMTTGLKVAIYPNPTQKDIHLKIASTQNDNVHVSVLDVTGRAVIRRTYSLNEWKRPILINDEGHIIRAGVYFIAIEQKKVRKVLKVIVE
jgi:hypothetical protein